MLVDKTDWIPFTRPGRAFGAVLVLALVGLGSYRNVQDQKEFAARILAPQLGDIDLADL